MTQLILDLEQMKLQQSHGAWGALLMWQFLALTGILLLLLALCFGLKKIRCDPDNSGHKEKSSSSSVEEEEGDNVVAKEDVSTMQMCKRKIRMERKKVATLMQRQKTALDVKQKKAMMMQKKM